MAHGENEIRIRLLDKMERNKDFFLYMFKSEFCPYSKIKHDKYKCVFAHNW